MERMSSAEYQEMIKKKKPSKMRNQKTKVDGITFDSLLEANYYCNLKLLVRTGEVNSFDLQPRYLLVEAFEKNKEKFKKMEYVADFLVTYADGRQEIVDCKGRRTQVYINKRKLFEKKYPDLKIIEVN